MLELKNVGNIASAFRETCRIRSTGEALGESANLTDSFGLQHFVVYHDILPVGHRASSPHSHSAREEFFFILAGTPKLWIDGNVRELRSGDYVPLPAGTGTMHYLYNEGPSEAQYLMIASLPSNDIVNHSAPNPAD